MQFKTTEAAGQLGPFAKQVRPNLITECLTEKCTDCSGSYVNKLIGYELQCKCECHSKKTLEHSGRTTCCSNVDHIQPNQQPGGLSDG